MFISEDFMLNDEIDDIFNKVYQMPRSKRLAVLHPIIVDMLQEDFPQVPKNIVNNVIREVVGDISKNYFDSQLEFEFVEKTIDKIFNVFNDYEQEN